MKRIVLIVTVGVTATNVFNGYGQFLKKHGWDVVVIANTDSDVEKWAAREGVRIFHVNFERDPSVLQDLKALHSTYKLLRKLKPDVVSSATPKAGLLGTLAAKLAGVPVRIYQLWGLRLETESGWKRRLLQFLERVAVNSSTQCMANSHSLAEAAEVLGITNAENITVLGKGSSHGVNVEYFSPQSVNTVVDPATDRFMKANQDFTVVYVGRLNKAKGLETLVKALGILRARGVSMRALFVGRIEDDTHNALNLSNIPEIHLTGPVRDVRPYILSADVLCLPTLREGFPNVVLEAAALHVPAVVTDATGAKDSVINNETGWVIPTEDAYALADILARIRENSELITKFGEHAAARVHRDFTSEQIWELQRENVETQLEAVESTKLKRARPAH